MKAKKIIITTIFLITVSTIALVAGSLYMIDFSLSPENRGKDLAGSYEYMYQEYPFLKPYIDSLNQVQALRDTFITADDGTRLHGYYIKAPVPTRKTAVIVHGYTDNAIRMMMIGYLYNHDMQYNVLLPDLRYSGESEGTYIQMGWRDRMDVIQWMDVAYQLYGDSTEMVVHGISMGAATTMMVSGEPQPSYVKCFVEDCGYTSVWEQFEGELKVQFNLPAFPLLHVANWLCKLKYDWSFSEASAVEQLKKAHLPMLFIHGDQDDFVPTSMVYDLYDAKPEPKELWVVAGVDHAHSYRDNKEEYTGKVKEFVGKYIN